MAEVNIPKTHVLRAKFHCDELVINQAYRTAKLSAVQSDKKQSNQDFNKYTPAGTIEMMTDKKLVEDFFIPGEDYYVDYTMVPKEEEKK